MITSWAPSAGREANRSGSVAREEARKGSAELPKADSDPAPAGVGGSVGGGGERRIEVGDDPGPPARPIRLAAGRGSANTSGGVSDSEPSQKGQL